MTDFPLLILLPLITMGLVIGFAIWSKQASKKKLADDDARKSSLAKDGPGPQPFR